MTTNTDLHWAMPELPEVVAFLQGEGPLDGVWFGEKHPTERGNFWWRKHLRAAIQQAAVPEGMVPVGWEGRQDYQQHDDPGWSDWRYISEQDLLIWCRWVAEAPEHFELRQLFAASPAPTKQQPALGRGEGGGVPLSDDPWDFWDSVGLTCAGYSAENDADLINVFIESATEGRWFGATALRLGLQESYVALLKEVLCSADFCEYGTSPRGAWAIHDKYEENLQKLKDWYLGKWDQEFTPAPRPSAPTGQINPDSAGQGMEQS